MPLELTRNLYDVARERKITFSQLLNEMEDEQGLKPEGSSLDAFQRLLKDEKIFTKTIQGKGINSSAMEAFYRTEHSKILFPEFIARQIREAIVEDTLLPNLIGIDTPIDTDTYRTFYVDNQPNKSKKVRVTEASELPRATIKSREQAVKIYKYGRAIEASYEVLRRMQIDMLALHVRRIAIETVKDKVEEVIGTIVSGDGNNNAATTILQKDLDGNATTAKTLTAKGFLRFLMEFQEFPCDTIIANKDAFIQLVLTNIPNLSTTDLLKLLATGTTVGASISAPQLPSGNVRVFWHEKVAANKLVGINRAYGIEQVKEVGSDIYESDKFITRQTEILTISETIGYSKIFKEATKILDYTLQASE